LIISKEQYKKLPEKHKQYFRNIKEKDTLIFHPTVKPESLISYLVRLVTPPNGTVLDLFMGTGTTLVAAEKEGFNSISIDSNLEYCEIAERRLGDVTRQGKIDREHSTIERVGF